MVVVTRHGVLFLAAAALLAQPQPSSEAGVRFEKGTTQLRGNEPAAAAVSFKKARELGLGSMTLLVRGAIALAASGDRAAALDRIEAAIKSGARAKFFQSGDQLGDLRNDPRIAGFEVKHGHARSRGPHRQFDFWVGEWNVFNPQGIQVGESRIEKITDGCVVHENWSSQASGEGKSYNFYDTRKGRWRQIWVDDSARVQEYEGAFRDGAIHYAGTGLDSAGKPVLLRMTFTPQFGGDVRQLIEQSVDEGKTYAVSFDGTYRRK
jgi:hypothetical protein